MNATELRIGNYINPKINGIILTDEIHKVDPTTLMMISRQIDNRNIEFDPIPLTEEILLKCGFRNMNIMPDDFFDNEKTDIEYHSQTFDLISVYLESFINIMIIKDLIIAINEKDGLYYFVEETLGGDENSYLHAISAPMQYLHTLQNYFPAFSGQELEINL